MEPKLHSVIALFVETCNEMEAKRAGSGLNLSIQVSGRGRWDDDKTPPKISLEASFWDGKSMQRVSASSMGKLMDEVYRRAGFEDREAMRLDELQQSFVALPSPTINIKEEDL